MTLDELKDIKLAAIQARTFELLAAPITFNGVNFSMCEHSQMLWLHMKTSLDVNQFPTSIPTANNSFYTLTRETAIEFFVLISDTLNSICLGDAVLKSSVLAASTESELNDIIDNR